MAMNRLARSAGEMSRAMSNWVRIGSREQLPPAGSAAEFIAEGQVLALFNVDGSMYALDGICPHQGGPLGKGRLDGRVVTCPWHGWQFDVCSGQHQVNPRLCHRRLEVKIEDGEAFVLVPPDEPTSA